MNNAVEERLREDLTRSAEAMPEGILPEIDAVLVAGRRAQRTRAMWQGSGLAAAALVGVVGVVLSLPPASGVVPAVPAATPTTATARSASAEFTDFIRMQNTPTPYDRVEVEARVVGQQVEVTAAAYLDEKRVDFAILTREASDPTVSLVRLGDRALLGVLPGVATSASLVHDGDGVSASPVAELRGMALSAMLVTTEKSVGDPADYATIWEDQQRTLRGPDGTAVPSATVEVGGKDYLIYHSEELDQVGIWNRTAYRPSEVEPDDLLSGGIGTKPDGKPWHWGALGILPAGAHDIAVTLANPQGDWAWVELSDGAVLVLAFVESESDKAEVVTAFSYTGADGQRVSFP